MPEAGKRAKSRGRVKIFCVHPEDQAGEKGLRQVARQVLHQEEWSFHLHIIIADDPELQRLHRQFLGIDEPTDVMAFPGDPEEDLANEIYLSLDQARVQALEDGQPVQQALERLLIHGILHLGGWRDDTPVRRRQMIRYGERYLQKAHLNK